jgi:hypothetical protein
MLSSLSRVGAPTMLVPYIHTKMYITVSSNHPQAPTQAIAAGNKTSNGCPRMRRSCYISI